MKKYVIISLMILLLASCSSSTPSGDGTGNNGTGNNGTGNNGRKNNVTDNVFEIKGISKVKEDIIKPKGDGKEEGGITLTYYDGYNSTNKYPNNEIIIYSSLGRIYANTNFQIENVNLYVDSPYIIYSDVMLNDGYIFFTDEKIKDYTLSTNEFLNNKDIYVISNDEIGNSGGSTLKIDGKYISSSNKGQIYLGLYVNSDKKTITTDKVHITKGATNPTKVHFIYNDGDLKNFRSAKPKESDFVIMVEGPLSHSYEPGKFDTKNNFIMYKPFPYGLSVYELGYEKIQDNKHIWKLKKKE